VGDVLLAHEEAQEGAALLGVVVADGSAECGVSGFEGVDDSALGDGAFDFEGDFAGYLREGSEMRGEIDADWMLDHARVWTSTERTGGRSWAMENQESPALEDA